MNDTRSPALEIAQLSLRIPGRTAEDGRSVAERAVRRLEAALSPTSPTGLSIPRLHLRLQQDTASSPEALADSIARGVIGALTEAQKARRN